MKKIKGLFDFSFREVYIRDIVERNKIEREDILGDILDFLASQISSLTNPTNISNALTSMKNEKISSTLVANYVQHTIDSFLISMAKDMTLRVNLFSVPQQVLLYRCWIT